MTITINAKNYSLEELTTLSHLLSKMNCSISCDEAHGDCDNCPKRNVCFDVSMASAKAKHLLALMKAGESK